MPTILKIYTFDENGFAKTVIAPACTKYQVSYADVDKEGSGRNPLTGEMYRERIGSYIKLDLTWDLIPGTTEYQNWYKTLTSLPKSFEAEYLDPSSNELVKKKFYRTDIQTELYLFVDENCNIWRGLSTSFVQNDVSSFSWEGVSRKIFYLGSKRGIGREVVVTNKQSFSNLDLIKSGETKDIEEYNEEFYEPTYSDYFISCEEKRVKLDGTFKFLDKSYSTTDGVKNSPIFWWTTWMCNKDTGEFNSHPRLVIKGTSLSASYYTIVFGEIATNFKIECYTENDNNEEVLDRTISVENNAEKEYIFETLKTYVKFIIEIIKIDNSVVFEGETQKYQRFAKVNTIYSGVFKNLNKIITDYEITQEFSADNSEFNSNVLSLKLRDANNEYDPQNANNKLSYFKNQSISVDIYVKDRDKNEFGIEVIKNPLVKTFKFNSRNNVYNWENQILSVTNYSDTYNLVYSNEDETPQFGDNAKTLSGWLRLLNRNSGLSGFRNAIAFEDLDSGDNLKEDYTNNAIILKGYIPNQSSYNEALRMLVEASYASQKNTTTGQYRNKMVLIDYNEQKLLFKTQLLENNLKFYGEQTIVSDRFVDNSFKITRNYIFEESFQEAKPKNYTVKIYTYQNVQEVTGKDDKGNDIVTTKIETTTYDKSYTISNDDYENETVDNPFITSNFMEDPVNWSKETSTIADRLVGYRQHIDSLNTFNFKTNFNGGIIEPGHTYLYESKYGNTKKVVITKVILNGTSFAEVVAKEIMED